MVFGAGRVLVPMPAAELAFFVFVKSRGRAVLTLARPGHILYKADPETAGPVLAASLSAAVSHTRARL